MASKSSRHNLTTLKLNWLNLILVVLIFLFPTNLFLSLYKDQAYVTGNFTDYLIVKIYLSEIILWFYIASITLFVRPRLLLWLRQILSAGKPKPNTLFLLLLVGPLIVFGQFLSTHVIVGLWTVVQWLEVTFLIVCMLFHFSLDQKRFTQTLMIGLISAILFQSVIAISQFLLQKSLLGFALLGEPNLTNAFNINKFTNFAGQERILPYGTTAHPNVLGGYLAVYGVLVLGLFNTIKKQLLKAFMLVIIFSGWTLVIITHSLSASLTIFMGSVIVLLIRQIYNWVQPTRNRQLLLVSLMTLSTTLTPLLIYVLHVILPTSTSIVRRNWLYQAAVQVCLHNPIFGTGLSQFVTQLTIFTNNADVWRFLQPVHSTPWVFLSEVGFLGVILLYICWRNFSLPTKINLLFTLLILLIPICFDHYLISIQPGRWLWAITFVGVFTIVKNFRTLER